MQVIDYIKSQGVIEFLMTQPIQRVFLFGSHTREEATFESDIDLLVDLDSKVDLFQFIAMKINLEKLLNSRVDLISSKGLSPRIGPYIEKEKVLIYEKQNQ